MSKNDLDSVLSNGLSIEENDLSYRIDEHGNFIPLTPSESITSEFNGLMETHARFLQYLRTYGDSGVLSYADYLKNNQINGLSVPINWHELIDSQNTEKKKEFVRSIAESYLYVPQALNLLFCLTTSHEAIYPLDPSDGKYGLWNLLDEHKALTLLLGFCDTKYREFYFSEEQNDAFQVLTKKYPYLLRLPTEWQTEELKNMIDALYHFCSRKIVIDSSTVSHTLFSHKALSHSLGKILQSIYSKDYPFLEDKTTRELEGNKIKVILWGDSLHNISHGIGAGAACFIQDPNKKSYGMVSEIGKVANTDDRLSVFQVIRIIKEEARKPIYGTVYMTTRNEGGTHMHETNGGTQSPPPGQIISTITDTIEEFRELWGVAPWHVMANDTIEILDLRIFLSDTSRSHLKKVFLEGKKIYFSHQESGKIANSILRTNLNIDQDLLGEYTSQDSSVYALARYRYPENYPELRTHGHLEVTFDQNDTHTPIPDIDSIANDMNIPIVICKIDITDPKSVVLQEYLEKQGYHFTALFPEKDMVFGYWFKNQGDKPMIEPFYMHEGFRERFKDIKGTNMQLIEQLLGRTYSH